MDEQFKVCRVYGHRWDSIEILFDRAQITEVLICEYCKSTRSDTINRISGLVKRRSYSYAAGYLRKDLPPLVAEDRGEMRLELILSGE